MPAPTASEIIDHIRSLENLPGQEFDGSKKTTIFAEDLTQLDGMIFDNTEAIENTVVRTFGAQEIDGNKQFNNDVTMYGTTTLGYTEVRGDMELFAGTNLTLWQDPTDAKHSATKSYVDAAISSAVATAIEAAKNALYPVGSIYTNATSSTNPGTLLGFGTWSAFGEGRVMVGKASSGTFGTAGGTMGAETHTITPGQMPDHGFGFSHHGDEGGSVLRLIGGHNYRSVTFGSPGAYRPPNGANGGAGSNSSIYWNFGNNEAHNNIQPSIVVYMWRRTA